MAREPVVIDFTGLGEQGHVGLMGSSIHGSVIDDERVSHVATRLVKPVPSVPEYHHLANAQIISRMPPVSATNSDKSGSNSLFARPGSAGLCRSPWVKKHAMAMGQIQEQSSGLTSEVSPGHSVGHSPSRVAWDLHTSGPSSPSHHTVIFAFNIFQALL
ncbi:hypothetical protein M758_UG194800 [Ceratodon purpureus]|nr:hypothetical protein M758_UG194800 [Ceratodon purpureus]